jgi:hypothetical protein
LCRLVILLPISHRTDLVAIRFNHNNCSTLPCGHAGNHYHTSASGLPAHPQEIDGGNNDQIFNDCVRCIPSLYGDCIRSSSISAPLSVLVSPPRPSAEGISNGGMDAFHSAFVTLSQCTYVQLSRPFSNSIFHFSEQSSLNVAKNSPGRK